MPDPKPLHELLAVHEAVKGQANKCRTELISTFANKKHHFEETRKTFRPLEENAAPKVEEEKDIQTTVAQEIDWITKKLVSHIDVGYQIDVGNTHARADVTVNGTTLLQDIPAPALMQLSKRLNEVQALIQAIPTLDPAKGFKLDADRGKGIWKAREITKPRTRKQKTVLTLAPATKEHAAQVQVYDADVETGTILEQEWSALISTATKADILDKVEAVIRAVQTALAKANQQTVEISDHKIGEKVLDFVFAPLAEQ